MAKPKKKKKSKSEIKRKHRMGMRRASKTAKWARGGHMPLKVLRHKLRSIEFSILHHPDNQ